MSEETPSTAGMFGDLFPTTPGGTLNFDNINLEETQRRLTTMFKDHFGPILTGGQADLVGFSNHIARETIKALAEVKDVETLKRILAHREAQTGNILTTYGIRAHHATIAAVNEGLRIVLGTLLSVAVPA